MKTLLVLAVSLVSISPGFSQTNAETLEKYARELKEKPNSSLAHGKISDITGQRERAINEYKLAAQTNDNTRNALDEAARYLKSPYER